MDLIGFIGLGWMGSNFARRLAESSRPSVVFDLLPERRAALAEQGAVAAKGVDQ